MKKMLTCAISAVSLLAGISAVSIPFAYAQKAEPVAYKDAAMTEVVEHTAVEYKVNANGQSYGIGAAAEYVEDLPDLVAAVGDNGVEGYVYASELLKSPSNPTEALEYKRKIDSGEYVPAVINVYESDGKTVVDTLTEILPD